ncbi:MAG: hypothetical protein AAGA85_20670 [Bacteroidota bacterium]
MTSDKFWISAEYGPAMDARAFYESKSKFEEVHWDHGVLLAGGHELVQRKRWALDIQSRLYMASVKLGYGVRREGTTISPVAGTTFFADRYGCTPLFRLLKGQGGKRRVDRTKERRRVRQE